MTYQEQKNFEAKEYKKQQPEYLIFLNALTKTLGEDWVLMNRHDEGFNEPQWKYSWNYQVWLQNKQMNIRIDFAKGSLFAPQRSGRMIVAAYCDHDLYSYATNDNKPFEISLSLSKDVFRIVSEIKSRLLPDFIKEYEARIIARDKQREYTKGIMLLVEKLRAASGDELQITPNISGSDRKDEAYSASFHHFFDREQNDLLQGQVYKGYVRFNNINASPEIAEQIVRLFFGD